MASAHDGSESFLAWLQLQLDQRNWSWSRLSGEADVVPSVFAKAKSGVANMGPIVLRRVADALGISQVEVFRRAGLLSEQTVAGDELAELGRLLAKIPNSERPRILHSLESMLKDLGESYVESQSDATDHAVDADANPAHADP